MNRTHHGSGSGAELHDAPPNSNLHNADSDLPNGHEGKGEVIDAGLRSLDHCMSPSFCPSSCTSILAPAVRSPASSVLGRRRIIVQPLLSHAGPLLSSAEDDGVNRRSNLVWVHFANSYASKDRQTLPSWRYDLRQAMLPLIRWETPYLAYFQDAVRTPALDSYFAITANLGTHTFFMVGLPILFWCGFPAFGKGLVHILAEGVFFTGFIKDMLSLPRPLSPPLNRITMSGSAALEYGFPSTHSANAVSVAVYAVLCLRSGESTLSPTTALMLELLGYFYAASIIIGRLYCGMHGFLDVIIGSAMGAAISLVEFYYGPPFDAYLQASGWTAPLLVALTIIVLVRVHPEPADDCPCFDDSVAFAGVMIGLEAGLWHLGAANLDGPFPGLSWPMTIARIVFGVLMIVGWRESMKPTLLKSLPYVFRLVERLGVSLPRRFFVPASEYKNIPNLLRLRTDNVLPTMRDFPGFVKTLRAPTRGRSVSIGPQSAADAYEALAYRERRRRESIGSNGSMKNHGDLRERFQADGAALSLTTSEDKDHHAAGRSTALADYEHQMGQGAARVMITRASPDLRRSPSPSTPMVREEPEEEQGDMIFVQQDQEDELGEKEMFSRLVKPRVKYDVEVVTKLVVYTGIGWLAVDGIPLMHELLGIGIRHLQVK